MCSIGLGSHWEIGACEFIHKQRSRQPLAETERDEGGFCQSGSTEKDAPSGGRAHPRRTKLSRYVSGRYEENQGFDSGGEVVTHQRVLSN